MSAQSDIKTPEAWNEEGRHFTTRDIGNDVVYADYLHGKVLLDRWHREVVAVRESIDEKVAHFRLREKFTDGSRAGRSENDPLHNDCIDRMHEKLCDANAVKIFTSEWVDQDQAPRKKQEVELWRSSPIRKPVWKKDPSTRIWINETTYFQPDIVGFDAEEPAASPFNRRVIIEVVHKHWPNEGAWNALLYLSFFNHSVIFYIVGDGASNNWMNRTDDQDPFKIRVSFHLRNGQLYFDDRAIVAPTNTTEIYTWTMEKARAMVKETMIKQRSHRPQG